MSTLTSWSRGLDSSLSQSSSTPWFKTSSTFSSTMMASNVEMNSSLSSFRLSTAECSSPTRRWSRDWSISQSCIWSSREVSHSVCLIKTRMSTSLSTQLTILETIRSWWDSEPLRHTSQAWRTQPTPTAWRKKTCLIWWTLSQTQRKSSWTVLSNAESNSEGSRSSSRSSQMSMSWLRLRTRKILTRTNLPSNFTQISLDLRHAHHTWLTPTTTLIRLIWRTSPWEFCRRSVTPSSRPGRHKRNLKGNRKSKPTDLLTSSL